MLRKVAAHFVIFGTLIGGTGCYHYVLTDGLPPDGARVELMMSTEAQRTLEERGVSLREFGGLESGALDGKLIGHTSDSLFVELPSGRVTGFVGGTMYQRIALANSDVVRIRQRKFAAVNSAVVGAAAGLVVTGLVLIILNAASEPF
jgi:hypothetical protein